MASMMASHDSQINATSDMTTIRLEIKLVRVIALTTLYTFATLRGQGSTLLHTFDFPGAGQLSPMQFNAADTLLRFQYSV
jgi:hypothetical protein